MKVIRIVTNYHTETRLMTLACGCLVKRPLERKRGRVLPAPPNIKCSKHESK